MKILLNYFVIILIVNFLSCAPQNEKIQERSMNDVFDSLSKYQFNVLHKGDTNSYYFLRNISLEQPAGALLPYALIMANKYDYSEAYYDVYTTLMLLNGKNVYAIDSLDIKTKSMALEYLKIAADRKNNTAIDIVDSIRRAHMH